MGRVSNWFLDEEVCIKKKQPSVTEVSGVTSEGLLNSLNTLRDQTAFITEQ